jgi:putative FmdB family regulatory protein
MIYEYRCQSCGHECVFEQKITDKPKKKCPECGKMKLQRLISRSSFALLGSGWYKDGY